MSKAKDKKASEYYASTEQNEARMHRLIALKLRNAMLTIQYYNKGRDEDCGTLFDIVDPSEEADSMIDDLRFFGFIPPVAEWSEGDSKP